jgi:diguanylate cyclase (GGDEF)-like protein
MYAWNDDGSSQPAQPDYMRRAAMYSYDILRIRDRDELWQRTTRGIAEWVEASVVRGFQLDPSGRPSLFVQSAPVELPPPARRMESELMAQALVCGRSLISNHPRLDPALADSARELAATDSMVHVLLLRTERRTHGVCAIHWLGTPRPSFERRSGFYLFAENAALAIAMAEERAALRHAAHVDPLTRLPNHPAFEAELERHAATTPMGVLVLDFDGMRAANAAFANDYARGGDVLIVAVARALERFAAPAEFPARMHTRGDEFCLLLPGSDHAMTQARGRALEAMLDELDVPESHRHVYRGASVGAAAREPGETLAQTVARASVAMHERKRRDRATPRSR